MNQKQKLFTEFFEIMRKMRKLLDQSIAVPMDQRITTILQIQALKLIDRNPGLSAKELADDLQMSSSAITQLTDRLVDAKLILRKPSQVDRRSICFKLSSTGKKHLQKSLESFKKKISKILAPMSEEDMKQVIRIFGDLLQKHSQ